MHGTLVAPSSAVRTATRRSLLGLALGLLLLAQVPPVFAGKGQNPELGKLPGAVQRLVKNLPKPAPGKKLIAVFDHDKTLVEGDVGEQFMKWMLRKGYFPDNGLLKSAQRAHQQGKLDDLELFKLAVTGMAGLKESRVQALAKRYYDAGFGGYAGRIFAPQKALIAELQRRGVEVHIVSGSNPWIIRESAKHLGVPSEHVHGMSVEVKDGRLTDRLVQPVPWREGKVAAIDAAKLRERGVIVFASGDSSGDLKMLELATKGGLSMTVNDKDAPAVAKVAEAQGYARAVFTPADTLAHSR